MNDINRLIARGGGVTQPMPDIMGSYRKGMATRALQNQSLAQPEEQAWRREARGRKREEWAQSDEDRQFEREIKALSMAIKADSPKRAKAIYKSLNPDGGDYSFDFVGGNVTLRTTDGFEIDGRKEAVLQLLTHFEDHPEWHRDPAISNQIFKSAAALGVNIRAPGVEPEAKESWSSPQKGIDEAGNPIIYQIDGQGNARIVEGVQPEPKKGMRLYDRSGQLILDTTGGKQEGKVMPASEVSKIGEFSAYSETMDQVGALLNRITESGSGAVTGPLEIINKKLDDWGVWPEKDRIEMRTIVARLPGLMYAMRGKQLSDKELEVALEMMPKMSQAPVAFAIAYKNFGEYMDMILKGKKAAFKGAGYQTGVFQEGPEEKKKPPLSSYIKE